MFVTAIFVYRFVKTFSKKSERWTLAKRKTHKTYHHIKQVQIDIATACIEDEESYTRTSALSKTDPRRIRPNLAPIPAPSTSELIKRHRSRFAQPPVSLLQPSTSQPVESSSSESSEQTMHIYTDSTSG